MWSDPIVAELHRIRETHAARFDNDLRKIAEDLRAIEANWPAAKITPPPPSPIEKKHWRNDGRKILIPV